MYAPKGIKANRCCCPDHPGELFSLLVTIDQPWANSLAEERTAYYKVE